MDGEFLSICRDLLSNAAFRNVFYIHTLSALLFIAVRSDVRSSFYSANLSYFYVATFFVKHHLVLDRQQTEFRECGIPFVRRFRIRGLKCKARANVLSYEINSLMINLRKNYTREIATAMIYFIMDNSVGHLVWPIRATWDRRRTC